MKRLQKTGKLRRVHIVGLAPRTGTTLMQELMTHCFDFDGPNIHEISIFKAPEGTASTICTKSPRELVHVLEIGPIADLWCICMIRDPRDVVVSRHKRLPDLYYADLRIVKENFTALKRKGKAYPNLICIRYEDLVSRPDEIQEKLVRRIPFLQKKARFSEFHKIATPSQMASNAMGGVREIDTSSIGNWRDHLPRIKAQLASYGPISDILGEFGYEADDRWLELLATVSADHDQPVDRPHSLWVRVRDRIRTRTRVLAARKGYVRIIRAKQP